MGMWDKPCQHLASAAAFLFCTTKYNYRVGQKLGSCNQEIKSKNYPAIRPDNASYPAGYRIVLLCPASKKV